MPGARETAEAILIVIKRLFKWLAWGTLGFVVLAGLGFGGIMLYEGHQHEIRQQERQSKAEARRERIERARLTATDEDRLVADMIELARQYGRYGYRRIAALLRDAGYTFTPMKKKVMSRFITYLQTMRAIILVTFKA